MATSEVRSASRKLRTALAAGVYVPSLPGIPFCAFVIDVQPVTGVVFAWTVSVAGAHPTAPDCVHTNVTLFVPAPLGTAVTFVKINAGDEPAMLARRPPLAVTLP